MGRQRFSADFQLMFRLLKLVLFVGSILTVVLLFAVLKFTIGDIFASLLAFLPTGWALLQVHDSFGYSFFVCSMCFSLLFTECSCLLISADKCDDLKSLSLFLSQGLNHFCSSAFAKSESVLPITMIFYLFFA